MPPTSPAALAAAHNSVGGRPPATASYAASRHLDNPPSSGGAPIFDAPPLLGGGFVEISMLVLVSSAPVLVISDPVLVSSVSFSNTMLGKDCTFAPSSETEVGT